MVSVQPRLPSLFEPPRATLGSAFASSPKISFVPERPVAAGEATDAVRMQTPDSAARGRGDSAQAKRPVELESPSIPGGPQAREQSQEQQKPIQVIATSKRGQTVSEPPPASHARQFTNTDSVVNKKLGPQTGINPAHASPLDRKDRPVFQRSEQSARETAAAHGGTASHQSSRNPRPEAEEQTGTAVKPRGEESAAVRRRPTVVQREAPAPSKVPALSPARDFDSNQSDSREPGPQINVVIGRVSVQAIMPQAASQRVAPPPPAPLLSLEQYMKQRGGAS